MGLGYNHSTWYPVAVRPFYEIPALLFITDNTQSIFWEEDAMMFITVDDLAQGYFGMVEKIIDRSDLEAVGIYHPTGPAMLTGNARATNWFPRPKWDQGWLQYTLGMRYQLGDLENVLVSTTSQLDYVLGSPPSSDSYLNPFSIDNANELGPFPLTPYSAKYATPSGSEIEDPPYWPINRKDFWIYVAEVEEFETYRFEVYSEDKYFPFGLAHYKIDVPPLGPQIDVPGDLGNYTLIYESLYEFHSSTENKMSLDVEIDSGEEAFFIRLVTDSPAPFTMDVYPLGP